MFLYDLKLFFLFGKMGVATPMRLNRVQRSVFFFKKTNYSAEKCSLRRKFRVNYMVRALLLPSLRMQ